MSKDQEAILKAIGITIGAFIVVNLILLGLKVAHQESDKAQALHTYAIKTKGHVEKYQTGTHVESRSAGEIPTHDGKGGTTTIYENVEVKDYATRIVYFDGRQPYYPEDHDEWLIELDRIKAEHGHKE